MVSWGIAGRRLGGGFRVRIGSVTRAGKAFDRGIIVSKDRTTGRIGWRYGGEPLESLNEVGQGNPSGLDQADGALAECIQVGFYSCSSGQQDDILAAGGREEINLWENAFEGAVNRSDDFGVPTIDGANDIVSDNAIGSKPVADELEELLCGEVLRNG